MSRAQNLRQRDIRSVYTLLGEVTELGSDPRAWRTHALRRLCHLAGGRVGLALDLHNLLPGCNPIPIDPIDVGFSGPVERLSYIRYLTSDMRAVDPSSVALCTYRTHQKFLTVRREELVGDAEWYGSPVTSEARRASNVDAFLCSLYRLKRPGSTTGFILYKNWGEEPFDDRCRRVVRLFHCELLRKLLDHGETRAKLPPHLTQVLQCLLGGHDVKRAADTLGLSVNTVKSYCKSLYERVGVSSRGELLAHYLNQPGQRPIILPMGLHC